MKWSSNNIVVSIVLILNCQTIFLISFCSMSRSRKTGDLQHSATQAMLQNDWEMDLCQQLRLVQRMVVFDAQMRRWRLLCPRFAAIQRVQGRNDPSRMLYEGWRSLLWHARWKKDDVGHESVVSLRQRSTTRYYYDCGSLNAKKSKKMYAELSRWDNWNQPSWPCIWGENEAGNDKPMDMEQKVGDRWIVFYVLQIE